MHPQLTQILAADAVIAKRRYPKLRGTLDAAVKRGDLIKILPGVLGPPSAELDWQYLAVAACAYADDVVLTGATAAKLGGLYPTGKPVPLEAYHVHQVRISGPIRWHRNPVPAQWRIDQGGLRFAAPAWAAVELAGTGSADGLDAALRGGISLSELWQAFGEMPSRTGNRMRRRLLKDSRDLPWSAAERLLHRLLRAAGIKGWRTNFPALGFLLDLAWPAEKVAIEVDGFETHGTRGSFESDRLRDQVLAANGWTVLRVTWAQLQHDPQGVLARLRRVLSRRRALAA